MPRYSTVTRKITTPLAAAANDPVSVQVMLPRVPAVRCVVTEHALISNGIATQVALTKIV